jgi:hypothetical protein
MSIDKLLAAAKTMSAAGGKKEDDSNFWRCETDKAGNGYAVIRFLPAASEDDLPFLKTFDHGFQGPSGKWFIEKCPTAVGKECPVCEANGPLWQSGREADKDIVRKRKRRTTFLANVLVVQDAKNPDNEGKVFLFKFGRKIFDKLTDAMDPQFGDETPMNPFDLDEGANFKLKIRRVEGYANFDKSEFDKPSKVKINKDDLIDMTSMHADDKFKSYDDLKKKFLSVIGGGAMNDARVQPVKETAAADEAPWDSTPAKSAAPVDDDDDMAFFRSIADD